MSRGICSRKSCRMIGCKTTRACLAISTCKRTRWILARLFNGNGSSRARASSSAQERERLRKSRHHRWCGCLVKARGSPQRPLPPQRGREIFRDQLLVKGPQFLYVGSHVTLCVKVVGIESAYPVEHLLVPIIHQVLILSLPMCRIKGMIPNHVERFGGQIVLHH